MVSGKNTLRPFIYFIMKHNVSMLYLKEIISLPILLEFESINWKFLTSCPLRGEHVLVSFPFRF